MAPDGRTLYVVSLHKTRSSVTGVIVPISTVTNETLKPIKLGPADGPITIAPDDKTAYVASYAGAIPVDLSSGTVGRPVRMSRFPLAYTLTISPDGKTLYVVKDFSNELYRFSIATNRQLAPVRLSTTRWVGETGVFGPGGKTLYVFSAPAHPTARSDPGIMTPIRVATGTAGRSVMLGSVALCVVFSR
jgi:DNA-binding beta-propeller fold protein YncE